MEKCVSHDHVMEVLHQLRVPDCDTPGLSISLTSSSSFSWYLVVALALSSCVAVFWIVSVQLVNRDTLKTHRLGPS